MKKRAHTVYGIGLLCLVYSLSVFGGSKPEKVYSIAKVVMENDWYIEQVRLWKEVIDKDPQNGEAWYSYYLANRYANFGQGSDYFPEEKKERLHKILKDMGEAIPNSFEYFVVCYHLECEGGFESLKKAYELQPDNPVTYDDLVAAYEEKRDFENTKFFCEKWYKSQDIISDLIDYNYNVLVSVEKKSILFTNGDNDTFPIWILQYAKAIRRDVTILNVSLIQRDEYLKTVLRERKIRLDVSKIKRDTKGKIDLKDLIQKILKQDPDCKIYFTLTVYPAWTDRFNENLYCIGLANQYSETRLNNVALIKKNLESRYRMDYLKYNWYNEFHMSQGIMRWLNVNYIAPLMILAEHYQLSGEGEKSVRLFNLAKTIAEKSGKKDIMFFIQEKETAFQKR